MFKPLKLNRIHLVLVVLVFSTAACNMPSNGNVPGQATPVAVSQLNPLVTLDPNAPPTLTPFQPSGPTGPVSTPTATALPVDEPGMPTLEPTIAPFINRLPRPDGQVNILLMGSDFRPGSGYRTDIMLLVSLNPKKGAASVISFPRDLYVYIPGWQNQRINTAQAHGGFESTVATFEENFGLTPDHYIMTNFNGFRGIIDTLGGIDVYSEKPLNDRCDLPQAVNSYCYVGVGSYHMDGDTALWYVRARYSTSDFDRLRRAQEVVRAIFVKLLNLNAIARGPELYNMFSSSVETDMTLGDALPLLPLASKLSDTSKINRYAVTPEYVTSWTTENGAAVLLPDKEKIWEEIIKPAVYEQ